VKEKIERGAKREGKMERLRKERKGKEREN